MILNTLVHILDPSRLQNAACEEDFAIQKRRHIPTAPWHRVPSPSSASISW